MIGMSTEESSVVKEIFMPKQRNRDPREESRPMLSRQMADQEILQKVDEKERHLADFVRRCLVIDPEERMTCEEALQHPFIAAHASRRPFNSS